MEDGSLRWDQVPQPIRIRYPADSPARYVLVKIDGDADPVRIPLRSGTIPPPEIWSESERNKPFKIQLIPEFFTDGDKGAFWHACTQLRAAVREEPLFREDAIAERIGVEAGFWPSGPNGLFDTKDHGLRRWYGDNDRAMAYAGKIGPAALVLVVINRPVWSGAGGKLFQHPSWANIENGDMRWARMALHELGHAFGLQDEYIEEGPPIAWSDQFPNVTKYRNALDAPWRGHVSNGLRPSHVNPTAAHGDPTVWDKGLTGSFEGAFYHSEEYYRPSSDCRMRNTQQSFCPTCAKHIRDQIEANSGH